jgi:hypothetical protein
MYHQLKVYIPMTYIYTSKSTIPTLQRDEIFQARRWLLKSASPHGKWENPVDASQVSDKTAPFFRLDEAFFFGW